MNGEVPLSPSLVSLVPVPQGFAPIGLPGSLGEPSVAADSLPQYFAPPDSPVSLCSSGLLLPNRFQSALDVAREIRRTSSPSATIPAVDSSLVESGWAGNSLSLESERFHVSFYSSPTNLTPTMDPAPVSLFREGPFAVADPHPRIGDNKGGCAYRFTSYRDYDYAVQDGHFGVQMHHLQFLEWVGAPKSTR